MYGLRLIREESDRICKNECFLSIPERDMIPLTAVMTRKFVSRN